MLCWWQWACQWACQWARTLRDCVTKNQKHPWVLKCPLNWRYKVCVDKLLRILIGTRYRNISKWIYLFPKVALARSQCKNGAKERYRYQAEILTSRHTQSVDINLLVCHFNHFWPNGTQKVAIDPSECKNGAKERDRYQAENLTIRQSVEIPDNEFTSLPFQSLLINWHAL